jgi:hypothetical protein
VVKDLLTLGPSSSWEAAAEPLVTRLIYQAGLTRSQALWAVENWAKILNTLGEAGAASLPETILEIARSRSRSARRERKSAFRSDLAMHLILVALGPVLFSLRARGILALLLLIALLGVSLVGALFGLRGGEDFVLKKAVPVATACLVLAGFLYYGAQLVGVLRRRGEADGRNPVAQPPTPPSLTLDEPHETR